MHPACALAAACTPRFSIRSSLLGATRVIIPSCVFRPSRVFSRSIPSHASFRKRSETPLLDFRGRSAHPFRQSPHNPEASTPRVKVPRAGFLALFAACSSVGPAGLFHPANALRLFLQGFPLLESRTSSSLAVAVLPFLRRLRSRHLGRRVLRRTLPLLLEEEASAFFSTSRPCSLSESVPEPNGLTSVPGRSPPGFSLSRVFPFRREAPAFTGVPPRCFLPLPLRRVSPSLWQRAALWSVARVGGGLASLEAALPS